MITITYPQSTAYAGEDIEKELCKENDGEWEDGTCDFDDDDEDKVDKFSNEVDKVKKFEEDKADLEDDVCDEEDAETTNIKLCKSDDLTLGKAFASKDKYDKEDCKADGGKWEDGWCDTNCYINGKKIGKNDDDHGICDQ